MILPSPRGPLVGRLLLPLTLLLLILTPACAKRVDVEPPEEGAPAGEPATRVTHGGDAGAVETPPVVFTLIDKGAAPRQVLRYQLAEGQVERIKMTLALRMDTELPGMGPQSINVPTYDSLVTMKVVEVTPEGNFKVEYHIDEVEVHRGEGIDDLLYDSMSTELRKIVGMAGWSLISPRGVVLASALTDSGDTTEDFQQSVGNLQQSLERATVLLPEEAVGAGASWRAETSINTQELAVTQVSTFTLTSVDEAGGQMAVEVSQSAPAQRLPSPDELPDAVINLTSMETTGTGTLDFFFRRPSSNMSMVLDMALGTTTEAMGMSMDTKVQTHMELSTEPVE